MSKFEPTEKDIETGDPQMTPNDITAQEAAHESGLNCEEEDCQECCPHDDLDHGICMYCEADLNDELCNRAHEISEGMER